MIIKVGINEISVVEQDLLNAGEYNIHECNFVFDEVYDGLVKKALFTNKTNTYQVSIVNNSCIIPYEVLQENGAITIGVYAYEVQDEELIMRYSPKPCTKYIDIGSYKEHYDNYEEITPTDKEQMEQIVQDIEDKMDNLDIDANKVDTTTTITITKKDGTTKEVEVLDGERGPQGIQGEQGIQGPTGPQGPIGETGNGISSINKTSTSGLVDTYTITYTNGTTTTFTVTNGETQDISGKEDKSNKATTISSSSTDTQYPSALAVYNHVNGIVGNINTLLDTLNRTEV